jgi:cell division septation protein DedD
MRVLNKASLVATAVAALAVVGGGVAFAGAWFAVSPTMTVKKLTTATMPGFDSRPAVELRNGNVTIQWVTQKLVKGVNVQRYLVRRYDTATGDSAPVCGGTVTVSKCKDTDVPTGSWEYTVRTAQYLWTGPESVHSDPITIAPTFAKPATATTSAAPSPSGPAPAPAPTTKAPSTPEPSVSPSPSATASTSESAAPETSAHPTGGGDSAADLAPG